MYRGRLGNPVLDSSPWALTLVQTVKWHLEDDGSKASTERGLNRKVCDTSVEKYTVTHKGIGMRLFYLQIMQPQWRVA